MVPDGSDIDHRYHEFLQRHYNFIWSRCMWHTLGNVERSRDLFQEAVLTILPRLGRLSPDATVVDERRWVKTQVRSLVSHALRRKAPPQVPITPQMADTLAADATAAERVELFDELAAHLPPDDRHLVDLYRQGYTGEEIAAALGTNRNTVYQRLSRAIDKMKKIYENLNQ